MARTLTSIYIEDSMDAPDAFGRPGNGGLLVARPGNNPFVPWCSVPEGFYALVTSNGAEMRTKDAQGVETPVFPSGYFFTGILAPFIKISHLVTQQTVIFDAPVKGCKTSDNVTVQIDVSVAFRIMGDSSQGEDPQLVKKFVHQVAPAGLESQLKDALAEEIRTLARSMKHTEVYACRTGVRSSKDVENSDDEDEKPILAAGNDDDDDDSEKVSKRGIDVTAQMKDRLNRQMEPQGVQISDVMIQDVVLPDEIVQQMSNRSLVRSKQEYEMMEQKFEMQGITLNNERKARLVQFTEEQEKAEVEGARDTQLQTDKFKERQTVRRIEVNDYEEKTNQQVAKVKAETTEMMTSLNFEKKRLVQSLLLEAEEESSKITAEAAAKRNETIAEAALAAAKHRAKAELVIAAAEEKADELLEVDRDLDITDARLEVYHNLVRNSNVVLSGSKDAKLNTLFLSDSILAGKGKGESHASLMAEMNALRLASSAYGLQQPGSSYVPDLPGSK